MWPSPATEVIDLIAGQVRIGYELDEKAIAKADINMGQAVTRRPPTSRPRRPGRLLGGAGLSYRVTEAGNSSSLPRPGWPRRPERRAR